MLVQSVRAPARARLALAALLAASPPLGGCAAEIAPDATDLAAVGEASLPIEGGYEDGDDRAVAGIAITSEAGYLSRTCSGTLIAPNLVMTAQHCVAETPKFVDCDSSTFGSVVDPIQVYVTLSDSMWAQDTMWLPAREVVRPPGEDVVCGRDLALIVLATPVETQEAAPLVPRLDRAAEVDESYSAVGFGNTSGDGSDGGARRRRDDLRIECVGYGCGTGKHVAGSEWRGDAGICNGDSGGPAIDLHGRVIGITSRGPVGCDDPIYGGLGAYREWIVAEAVRAAEAGGYAAPAWVGAAPNGDLAADEHIDPRWASCAHAPPPAGRGAAALAALALALLGLARRRSTIPA